MRWCQARDEDGGRLVGLMDGDKARLVRTDAPLVELIRDGTSARREFDAAFAHSSIELPLRSERLVCPIDTPPSLRDFMAFEEHVVTSNAALGKGMDDGWYTQPTFYFSNPKAARGPYGEVAMAPGTSASDFELEIAVLIGEGGRDISPSSAWNHIAGFILMCDWSSRDLQEVEMRQGLGPAKGKDTATSFGPMLVTADEFAALRSGNAFDLELTASVNGREYSRGNVADIYWSFEQMISYASRGTALVPGDVIGSGTVGTGCILELSLVHGNEEYPWLVPGDHVTLTGGILGDISAIISEATTPLIPLN